MPQRKTRKLSVRAYFPLAMSASRLFNVFSSSPTLAGVPFGQFFVGQDRVEVVEPVCPAASKLAFANRNTETTRMNDPNVFFMISAPERTRGRPAEISSRLTESPGL